MNRTLLFIVKGEWFYELFFLIRDYHSRKKFKAKNERHKTEAFLNSELRSSFSKLSKPPAKKNVSTFLNDFC